MLGQGLLNSICQARAFLWICLDQAQLFLVEMPRAMVRFVLTSCHVHHAFSTEGVSSTALVSLLFSLGGLAAECAENGHSYRLASLSRYLVNNRFHDSYYILPSLPSCPFLVQIP